MLSSSTRISSPVARRSVLSITNNSRSGSRSGSVTMARPPHCCHQSFGFATVSRPSLARAPYFQKQLNKRTTDPVTIAAKGATPHSLVPLVNPPSPSKPKQFAQKPASSTTTATTSKETITSKRSAFRSITPPTNIMADIRLQGLGSNSQTWSFDKSTRGNKTIRPWDKKLDPETFKAQQKAKRLPSKQVWFEERTTKVIEKEQVKFPGMRFIAGANKSSSVPTELGLLKMARRDLFEGLEEIENLLLDKNVGEELIKNGKEEIDQDQDSNTFTNTTTTTTNEPVTPAAVAPRIILTKEQIAELTIKKREQERKLENLVLAEIGVVGRSNVGKSTMINTLTESPHTARVSSKPGLTRQLNFYNCGSKFVVVDMPGYGFAFGKEEDRLAWKSLIEDYIKTRKTLKRLYVMIDARHGLKQADKEFMTMLDTHSTKFQIVLTKCDLIPPPDLARRYKVVQEELSKSFRNAITDRLLMVSSYTGAGMNLLRKDILFVCGQSVQVRDREMPKNASRGRKSS